MGAVKILSVKQTTSELSRAGRRIHPTTKRAIVEAGVALLITVDEVVPRSARISTRRGTWAVLERPSPTALVLLPSLLAGHPRVGDEVLLGEMPSVASAVETERREFQKQALAQAQALRDRLAEARDGAATALSATIEARRAEREAAVAARREALANTEPAPAPSAVSAPSSAKKGNR